MRAYLEGEEFWGGEMGTGRSWLVIRWASFGRGDEAGSGKDRRRWMISTSLLGVVGGCGPGGWCFATLRTRSLPVEVSLTSWVLLYLPEPRLETKR